MISAGYKAAEDVLLYASLSHGEKSGGINLAVPGPAGAASLLVGSERANAAELGVKSTLFGRRLQLNANLFATMLNGYQSNAYDHVTRSFSSPTPETCIPAVWSLKRSRRRCGRCA